MTTPEESTTPEQNADMTTATVTKPERKPRNRPSRSKVPEGFTVVEPTDKEVERYQRTRPNATPDTTRRLKCRACKGRIWESGVGLRAHRRTCVGHPKDSEAR